MTQKTQVKMTAEFPVSLSHPVKDETARLSEELEAGRDQHLRLAAEYQTIVAARTTEREPVAKGFGIIHRRFRDMLKLNSYYKRR
jgi:hypothetical protein